MTLLLALLLSQAFLHDGDIVFQESRSSQSVAIQRATHSPYSHMGIVFARNGRWYVYEAVGPVQFTPFDVWTQRGRGGHFVVKRLRRTDLLTGTAVGRMQNVAKQFAGRPYDWTFEWDDRRIYCSELVWKIYKRAIGVEIGHLQRLRDFDLKDPRVRQKLQERYGRRIPLDEPVISPGTMFESAELVEVMRR